MTATDLVNFVDKDEWILGADLLERLNSFTWHGTDVCPSVTLDLGNVAKTTNTEAEELTLDGSCNRLSDRRLTNTWRTDKADDLAFHSALQLADSQELKDAVLDVRKTVVILVKNASSVGDRVVLGRVNTPGDAGEPVEVASGDVELARSRLERLELVELLVEHLAYGLRHIEGSRLFAELFNHLVLAVAFNAKLLLDSLELLHEVVLALSLLNLGLNVLANLALQLSIHKLFLEHDQSFLQSLTNVESFKNSLQLAYLASGNGSGEIGKLFGLLEDVASTLRDGEVGNLITEKAG